MKERTLKKIKDKAKPISWKRLMCCAPVAGGREKGFFFEGINEGERVLTYNKKCQGHIYIYP